MATGGVETGDTCMDAATLYELVGYVGSALVVVSLTMRSLFRLRLINLVGAAIFTVYGLLISAPPVWVVNGAIVLIDIWELRRMFAADPERLEVLQVSPESAYLRRLLQRHTDDLERFVPDFEGPRADHNAYLVLRDGVVAAVVLVRCADNGEWTIDLDYALPQYRDHTSGRFVYAKGDIWDELGTDSVVSAPGSAEHRRYLQRMGFEPDGDMLRRAV